MPGGLLGTFKSTSHWVKCLTYVIAFLKMVHCIYVIFGPKGKWPFAKACEWNLFGLEKEDWFQGTNAEGNGA